MPETQYMPYLTETMKYRAVLIGGSSGIMEALPEILHPLPDSFPLPLIIITHLYKNDGGGFCAHLGSLVHLPVQEAIDKQIIEPAHIYTAPANYHLLAERNGTLALSVDARVKWSRPSIDVLFESAAIAFGQQLIAVILSGSNDDGARGMKCIYEAGGICIAQDPASAISPVMPESCIQSANIELVLPPADIGAKLIKLADSKEKKAFIKNQRKS
jgi:two-component system chemotaxis response regulator CheB